MATLPSFRTWVTGEIVTAAELNSNVRDSGNFFLSWPVAELRQTVAQSLANLTQVAVTFDAEDVDTDNAHSTSTNTSRYTPVTAGRFQFSGKVGFAANGTGQRDTTWAKNGAVLNGSGTRTGPLVGVTVLLPAQTQSYVANGSTDYFELWAQQGSGGALNTAVTTSDQSAMTVRMVGTT